jgi:hypothetical protein
MPIPLNHVGAGVVTLASPTSGNVTLTLPIADGTNGQALTTNGSGQLVFATVGGGGGVTISDVIAFSVALG